MTDICCAECYVSTPHYQMHDNELCLICAKELGVYQQPDNAQEIANVRQESQRVNEENQAAFNKEQAAQAELAVRALARRRLLPFIMRVNPDYMPGWVHADICERLERFALAIENKESPRLMITMPPRAGKSEIASKTFPSWYLGRNPSHDIMVCSYSGDLAKDFSRKCRDLLETDEYKTVFPTRLSRDSKSVERWNTTTGGSFVAAGVGGAITGRGAHLAVIDDPVKNREEAESETTRQTVKDWYSSALYTRLSPGGGLLIVQTRWHFDDLSGWLLTALAEAKAEAAKNGEALDPAVDDWELVEYPAVAVEDEKYRKKGEALHPARYPIAALNKIKHNMIPRDWEALYQQKPVSDDGDYFTKSMFRYYKPAECPPIADMRIYAAGDLAISQRQSADYTVFVVLGVDRQQNLWVIDVVRGRWNSLGIIDRLFEIQSKYDPELFGLETGQIELTLEPFIIKAEQEKNMTLRYEKLKTKGDKVARARTIQGRMEQGRVYFPTVESVPWMSALQNEMLKFPLGVHDDQVDALAHVGQMLVMFGIRNEKKIKPKQSWRDKMHKFGGGMKGQRFRSGMSS